jgi:hypothetical protein
MSITPVPKATQTPKSSEGVWNKVTQKGRKSNVTKTLLVKAPLVKPQASKALVITILGFAVIEGGI